MKTEDLKKIYPITQTTHNSVLSALNMLEDKSPAIYKKRKTVKIVFVCAVIVILSATAVVVSATKLFGLFEKQVGKYGMNITVYDDTQPADKLNVKLNLGYMPDGYKQIENTTNYSFGGEPISEKPVFCFDIKTAENYELNVTYIIDNFETEYNGNKTIVMTRQFEENGTLDYIAVKYFEGFGCVVECYSSDYAELLKIVEKLELQEDTEYTQPSTIEKIESTEDGYDYSYKITDTFTFAKVGDSFNWSDLVIYGADDVPEFAKSADNFTIKVKSIEETDNCNSLDSNYFLYSGNEEFKANFFDENGQLITPYTRQDRNNGDGIDTLDKVWETVDDRHFYVITIDVTSNTEYTNFSSNGCIWASAIDETGFSKEYGEVSLVYLQNDNQKLNKGDTKEIKIGVVADDDVAKYACLTFETTNRNVNKADESVKDVNTYTCIRLDGEVDYD